MAGVAGVGSAVLVVAAIELVRLAPCLDPYRPNLEPGIGRGELAWIEPGFDDKGIAEFNRYLGG